MKKIDWSSSLHELAFEQNYFIESVSKQNTKCFKLPSNYYIIYNQTKKLLSKMHYSNERLRFWEKKISTSLIRVFCLFIDNVHTNHILFFISLSTINSQIVCFASLIVFHTYTHAILYFRLQRII